jgi:hypothetical protein
MRIPSAAKYEQQLQRITRVQLLPVVGAAAASFAKPSSFSFSLDATIFTHCEEYSTAWIFVP